MANFEQYLQFSENEYYREKQLNSIKNTSFDEKTKERLSKLGDLKLMIFAHPECGDSLKVIGILEAMRKFIPSISIDYRKRKDDKELLLKLSPAGRIPTIFVIKDEKYTEIFCEFPNSIREEIDKDPNRVAVLRALFHMGNYDAEVIEQLIAGFENN